MCLGTKVVVWLFDNSVEKKPGGEDSRNNNTVDQDGGSLL